MKYLLKIYSIHWLKTIWINFLILPFSIAYKFPIIIYKNVNIFEIRRGGIVFCSPIKVGLLQIGRHGVGTIDLKKSRTMLEISGTLMVLGKASIGSGSKISIATNAVLTLGDDFLMTGRSSIICQKAISFGEHCLLSWDILIMDTDFHEILNQEDEIINLPKPIHIGTHVWIGCRTTILKGVDIADNTIIAACSTISCNVSKSNVIYGDNGRILKEGVRWLR